MSSNPIEKRGSGPGVDNNDHEYYPSSGPALIDYPSGSRPSSLAGHSPTFYPDLFVRPSGFQGFFYNPYTQVVLLGFVCFACPGLFNALNGLGAGGQVEGTTNANANSTLYATFALAAFFAGYAFLYPLSYSRRLTHFSSVNNVLGPRMTLFLGSSGYAIYIGSYL
jgi:hypothetical protein